MTRKILQSAFWVTIATLASKILGFIRDVVLAYSYGTTLSSDAFIMAQSIIGIFSLLLFAALGTTFIPVMSDYLLTKSKTETNKFLNVTYSVVFVIVLLICILGMLFTRELVNIFAPNFTDHALNLTVHLTWLMFPSVVLSALIYLNNANLQNHNRFLIPALLGLPVNVIMIVCMLYFTEPFGIEGLTVAFIMGTLAQLLFQIPYVNKLGYRIKFQIDLKEEGLRRIGILVIPILIGSGIQQLNTLVDRMLASGLPEGSVAALTYSNRLGIFVVGLISAAIVSVFFASMSNYFAEGETERFRELLRKTINLSLVLIVPASVGFIVLCEPLIKFLFERGMFDSTARRMTASALLFYSIGLAGYLLRDVLSRAFYALKDTKTVMVNGSIAVLLNIILSLIFVRYLGIGGLAFATSISGIVGTVLLLFRLRKKIGDFGLRNIRQILFKVLAASAMMGTLVHFSYVGLYALFASNTIALLAGIMMGVASYTLMILLFKIDEIAALKHMVLGRLKHSDRREEGR